jgi:[acyl-carrier-protein] S-malonyltransferase
MGKDFYDTHPAARETFETANRVMGFDLAAICFNGPEERLNQTDISQPAIYVTSIACFRAASAAGVIDPAAVTAYAGLSLGEYTALHLAGAFDFEDGLNLVAARGRYMQEAAVASPSGMVAIIGADRATVSALCQQYAQGEVLVAANFNTPGQIVVSGSIGACERVLKAAEAPGAGFRATPLKVAGAFHSPLMQPAADRMKGELDRAAIGRPEKEVYSNVTAAPHDDVDRIKELLVEQIVSPVLWEDTMVAIMGVTGARFVELGPNRHLAGMARRINRKLAIESLEKADAVTGR